MKLIRRNDPNFIKPFVPLMLFMRMLPIDKHQENAYNKALAYASEMHEGQFRKDTTGEKKTPYISHPIAVAEILRNKGFGYEYLVTALFHDLREDTKASLYKIWSLGNYRILRAVLYLTKPPKSKNYVEEVFMKKYLSRVKRSQISLMVKLADRLHNLLEAPMAGVKFCIKYIKETEEYYLDLAKGTVFEEDITNALNLVKQYVQSMQNSQAKK